MDWDELIQLHEGQFTPYGMPNPCESYFQSERLLPEKLLENLEVTCVVLHKDVFS